MTEINAFCTSDKLQPSPIKLPIYATFLAIKIGVNL